MIVSAHQKRSKNTTHSERLRQLLVKQNNKPLLVNLKILLGSGRHKEYIYIWKYCSSALESRGLSLLIKWNLRLTKTCHRSRLVQFQTSLRPSAAESEAKRELRRRRKRSESRRGGGQEEEEKEEERLKT